MTTVALAPDQELVIRNARRFTRGPGPRPKSPLVISGRLTAWDSWHEVTDGVEAQMLGLPPGQNAFLERVARGAMTEAFARHERGAHTIKLLFSHGLSPGAGDIGMKPIGKILSVREDADGPSFTAQMLTEVPSVAALEPAIRAGALAPSYAFNVSEGTVRRRPPSSDENPRGIPELTVTRISRLKEISLVTFAADQEASVRVVQPGALVAA